MVGLRHLAIVVYQIQDHGAGTDGVKQSSCTAGGTHTREALIREYFTARVHEAVMGKVWFVCRAVHLLRMLDPRAVGILYFPASLRGEPKAEGVTFAYAIVTLWARSTRRAYSVLLVRTTVAQPE